jgi:hypothetical protein
MLRNFEFCILFVTNFVDTGTKKRYNCNILAESEAIPKHFPGFRHHSTTATRKNAWNYEPLISVGAQRRALQPVL